MKILITGGSGFIARSLCENLEESYEVVSANREMLDLLDSEKVLTFIRKNNFDIVIHTATYDAAPKTSNKDPSKVLENHLSMFSNITRCEEFFKKMIYFGTGAEFDRKHWVPRMNEDYFDKYVPDDQYGYAKYLMTKCALSSEKIFNLRLFGVFGKYDDWRYRFLPNACACAVFGQPILINQNAIYDYLYINDLIEIVRWFLENKPKKHVYNVCSGQSYDLNTLAKKVVEVSGKSLEIKIKAEGLRHEYSGDNSLLLSELKDLSLTSMDESIQDLYNWYDKNKSVINKEELYKYI